MATSCQSCNTLGLIPTAPPYAGSPPAPPVQGCAAVWGQITGSVANQTDIAAYIQGLSQTKTFILGQDLEVSANEPKATIPTLTAALVANSAYQVTLHLQTGWGVAGANSALYSDLVLPVGAQFSGTWTAANDNGLNYSNIDGDTTGGILRINLFDAGNFVTNTTSTFLIRTSNAGNLAVRAFTDLGEETNFFIYAGSWMNLTKLA